MLPNHLPSRRPGGYGEGPNTRSHPELGREIPQRQWYCVLRRGRVGRRQVFRTEDKYIPAHPLRIPLPQRPSLPTPTSAGWSSPVARQAHNLKVVGSNPTPATKLRRQINGLAAFRFQGPRSVSGWCPIWRASPKSRKSTISPPRAPEKIRA